MGKLCDKMREDQILNACSHHSRESISAVQAIL